MWSFFFKTMPVTQQPREWALSMVVAALFVFVSAGVLGLLPGDDPRDA